MVSTPVIHVTAWITTHSPTLEGWKAELDWLVDSRRTPYLRSGHMSTIDQAEIRESPPAKDRSPNHWATPARLRSVVTCSTASWANITGLNGSSVAAAGRITRRTEKNGRHTGAAASTRHVGNWCPRIGIGTVAFDARQTMPTGAVVASHCVQQTFAHEQQRSSLKIHNLQA